MFAAASPQDGGGRAKPNVIVILTDDQGWGDLSCNGNVNLATPNVDALARKGASFAHFYVSPVCSPTRAEFLTGRYHPRTGVYSTSAGGERIDLDESTIAQSFRAAGYATAAFGKWHNGMQDPYHPNARGFDEFYGFCSGHWGDYFSPPLEHNGDLVRGNGFVIDDFTERAMAFVEKHRDRPFFVYLPFNTPHSPMQVPDRWWKKFADKQLKLHHRDPAKEKPAHVRAALAMCENIDWNVGRLLAKLDDLGLTENTIVVFFSDNGPNGWRWNGGMRGRKGSTDEGGVRSLMFVRWPGKIEAGRSVTELGAAIDLFPTLVELAGVRRGEGKPFDGKSLAPLLTGERVEWPDRLIFSHWRGRVSVRSRRYRLDHRGRLYDMTADPGQRKDVADRRPEVTKGLRSAVARWRSEVLEPNRPRKRPFTIGKARYTQLPARDATPRGGIERSNRFPNCSYFTHWTSREDAIVWPLEVLEAGEFEVEIYYACAKRDLGARIELRMGEASVSGTVREANDPPVRGAEHDRVPRMESYVRDFRPMKLGTIRLEAGKGELRLRALAIPGAQVMDFRLLQLRRLAGR